MKMQAYFILFVYFIALHRCFSFYTLNPRSYMSKMITDSFIAIFALLGDLEPMQHYVRGFTVLALLWWPRTELARNVSEECL